jgi:nucleotide-binding universal stress UspA family protein
MKPLQKILIPIDFSDDTHNAVQHACYLIEKQPAQVVLMYVNTPDNNIQYQDIHESFRTLESNTLRHAPFLYHFEVVNGNLLHELANASEKHQADLVIMGLKERVSDFALTSAILKIKQTSLN